MAKVQKTVLVPHTAEEMFLLVDNLNHYTQFLPWCGGVDVIEQTDAVTIATIHINFHGLRQHFTTENHKTKPTSMKIHLKSGPFKQFDGLWHFTALNEEACKIEFMLSYEFSSLLLEKIIAPVFSHIADTFVDSFVKRADVVYKKG
jgi:ribosome-associated toxin RatA of RatAB toxin-antitoxin module